MLAASGLGLGSLAFHALIRSETRASEAFNLKPKTPPLLPRARSIILLMQNGGPSQMDLFDRKPELQKHDGQQHTIKVEMFQRGSEQNKLMASPMNFRRFGQCGMEMADVIPHIGSVCDELTLVRSMHTGHNNHTEGLIMFMTGRLFQGWPTLGAWISYALGTENQNLPAYVVLRDPSGYNTSGTLTWSNGFLPALYRGTEFASEGPPVPNLYPRRSEPDGTIRDNLAFLEKVNRRHQKAYPHETELESRIQNYEMAARMQLASRTLLDLAGETPATHRLYGLDRPDTRAYGLRCLLACKLVEAGVRFVQIHPRPFQPWDTHNKTKEELTSICQATDQPAAALILDLKQRGLLDETIVVWSGEFGRLPVSQNGTGRDHNRNAFSLIAAGGGFRSGYVHGETDEVGYRAVRDKVSVSDFHATLLHQLGLAHDRLTYPHSGRDETLTDPSLTGASVIEALLSAHA